MPQQLSLVDRELSFLMLFLMQSSKVSDRVPFLSAKAVLCLESMIYETNQWLIWHSSISWSLIVSSLVVEGVLGKGRLGHCLVV